jgi:uncharacterized membrane protein
MKNNKLLLSIILVLSIIGLITSIYLTNNHYDTSGTFCDTSDAVSCSLVNSSVFSEILNVPVAILGALWFVLLLMMTWKAMKKDKYLPVILGWSILGLFFVAYFIIAEIILKAICPLCTIVHAITILIFVMAFWMFKKTKHKLNKKELIKLLQPWIISAVVFFVLFLLIFNLRESSKEDYSELTKCAADNGVTMYGSFRCGVCAKQKALLGDAYFLLNEIECHPQGPNAQLELCIEKGIEGTPTWIMEKDGKEIKRDVGYLDIDQLREFSGCHEVSE